VATILDGKALAERIRADVKADVAQLGGVGLATILVGDDPASQIYIGLKHKAATEVGIEAIDVRLPAETSEEELLEQVEALNADDSIDGLLVQLPLPAHVDEALVLRSLDPAKDVDGLHPWNAGHLFLGRPTLVGATPVGILALLDEYRIPLEGARAVVVGRSDIVGKPVAALLLQRNATVTVCHSRTRDLAAMARDAEILVAAIGKARFVTAEMIRPGAVVIDVGINRVEGKLAGDVDFAAAQRIAGWITPVPGGVGPMTIAVLMSNTVRAAVRRRV